MQNFRALGALPLTPVPPAAGGSAPRPPKQPPLRISGYAPDCWVVLFASWEANEQFHACGIAKRKT